VIEWIAKQPWSSGKVGGIGQSYFGFSQWLMAAMQPPHLTCIAPYDALFDPYRCHGYHGGIYCSYRTNWYTNVRSNNLHRAADRRRGRAMEFDLGLELTRHDTYDGWWRERTAAERAERIKIPVLSIGHWAKAALHLRGNLEGFKAVNTDKKLLVTAEPTPNHVHHLFDTIEFHEKELLPFYDRYLKGERNGYEKLAPVRIHVRGADRVRSEKEWPIQRATHTSFYLTGRKSGSVTSLNDGSLSADKPAKSGGSTRYSYPDAQWLNGVVARGPNGPDPVRRVLTFTSPPLEEDMEVTGEIVLELYASSDQVDTDFIVKVADQAPQSDEERKKGVNPAFVNVSKGWLKASHHTTRDPKRSTPYRPFYKHDDPRPLVPGKAYRFEVEILPTSYLFRKGRRIRLEIVNGDSGMTDQVWVHPYHPDKIGSDTVFHDSLRPSRLLLPVMPPEKAARRR
jgi:putative CocE/NonD family hydrolase